MPTIAQSRWVQREADPPHSRSWDRGRTGLDAADAFGQVEQDDCLGRRERRHTTQRLGRCPTERDERIAELEAMVAELRVRLDQNSIGRSCIRSNGVNAGVPVAPSVNLPEMPRLDCVEHWVQKRRCECGHLTSSSFPAGVTAPACYRPRIRALGVYLVCYQHLPYKRAAEILSDWARAPISVGSLQAFVAQGADGLERFLEEVRCQLEGADVAHSTRPADGSTERCHGSIARRPSG